MMRRRDFIALIGPALAVPILQAPVAYAQKVRKVGFLYPGPVSTMPVRAGAFNQGLAEGGFRIPADIELISRSSDGNHMRLEPLARELIGHNVEVIVALSPSAINVVRRTVAATNPALPIVAMSLVSDPVASGWVESLAQPGGNFTGLFLDFPEFSKKWLELLKEAVPEVAKIAVFWDPATGTLQRTGVEQAAQILKIELDVVAIRTRADLDPAFAAARDRGCGAVLMTASPIFGAGTQLLAELAGKHRLPTITPFADFARAGGLIAYGPHLLDTYRQVGGMVAKVLQGRKPADLPVERHSKFELVVNLKAAKELGVALPTSILLRANEVIE
jgi:putative ABC transport system substrate-binding protein